MATTGDGTSYVCDAAVVVDLPRSLHAQIADDLRDAIHTGRYRAGSLLPAEPVLAEQYGVSRVTVNRAVTELRRERLVEIRRGVGTYVLDSRLVAETDGERADRFGAGLVKVAERALELAQRADTAEDAAKFRQLAHLASSLHSTPMDTGEPK